MNHQTPVTCTKCKKNFSKITSEINRNPHERHFCSQKCYLDMRREETPIVICTNCKNEYKSSKKKYKTNFCSKECQLNFTLLRNDFTGKEIGRCVVTGLDKESESKEKYWLLQCACKEVFSCRHTDIKRGNIFECPNCIFRRSQFYIGGKKYGRLSVQNQWEWRISPTNGKRFRHWFCICECGNELWINANSILRGHTLSCGCYFQKSASRYVNETLYPKKHGLSGKQRDFIYLRWTTLIAKCYNPKYSSYHNWGAEGFAVCDAWKNNYQTFREWALSKDFQPTQTIEIKNFKKTFSPENCYIIDFKKHCNKMREKTHLKIYGIEYKGQTHGLAKWAEILGIGYRTLQERWRQCKDLEKCINGDWLDGSGCHFKRVDISDEQIKDLYEQGMTIREIENKLKTKCISYRLNKMGIKMRAPKKRAGSI